MDQLGNFIHSSIGLVHVVASLISLITGTCVLLKSKGDQTHKRLGYVYTFSMLVVNGTAFGLYGLFGFFGPFHVAALISISTLLAGIIPVIFRVKNWLNLHVPFMYYSVIGLYAAFVSEIIVRIPGVAFGPAVGIATFVVMSLSMYLFRSLSKKWLTLYPSDSK